MARSIEDRLGKLEADSYPGEFPDWDMQDQSESVVDTLLWFKRFHAGGSVRYEATDREIHLIGLLCAARELEQAGEYEFPSALRIKLAPNGEVETPRLIRIEDLPGGVREYFNRLEPEKQPKRDLWLYQDRHRARESRKKRWEVDMKD